MRTLSLYFLYLVLCACAPAEPPLTLTDADIADNNRAVATMGNFDYAAAHVVLQSLVDRQPAWLDARVNLAIATLNRQEEGDEARALELVTQVLERDPTHLRAHYVSGLLRLYLGETENAETHFRRVADADPDDAYAAYYLGQSLVQLNRVDEAVEQYRRAMALDPYLRSAYYGAALALRRSGNTKEANTLLKDYQRFENNPRARLAEFKYTRMGPRAEVVAIDRDVAMQVSAPSGDVFAGAQPLLKLPALSARSSLTTVDINRDHRQDFFVTRVGADGHSAVVVNSEQGFTQIDHPLAETTAVNAVAWGDLDNDGLVDAYLCRQGANQLWRQESDGDWVDITVATGTANAEWDCADVLMVDADHDGDLDVLLVNSDGPNELYNNNLDGTFRPLAADYGIDGRRGSLGAIAGDLDNDRDLDLIVIKSEPPHEVFINDRLWQYRSDAELLTAPINAASLADGNTDGLMDMYAVHGGGVWRRAGSGAGGLAKAQALVADIDANAQIALMDFDGDGVLDILTAGASGWSVYSPAATRELASGSGELAAALPIYLSPGRGPDLVVAHRDGSIERFAPGPGRFDFAALSFTGKEEQADSMRSNRDGLGTRVEFRVGSRWTIAETLDRNSLPGQSLQPLMLGLGGAEKADFAALTWSDGVYQTELDISAGQLHRIEETQRQLSSCPVLFAWDGNEYRFVTDLLGVGGLGFFVEPGMVATPRPWEFLLLPPGLLVEKDGLLSFKLTEPMEELAYVDSVRLHAYDLRDGLSMVLDERMVIAGPPASGKPLYYRSEMTPLQAINQDGEDITHSIMKADRSAAPVGELDSRFIGRLAQTHVITLDFAQPLDAPGTTPVLIVDGWVEYPYSQTVFAAWQASEFYESPTLEAFGRDGYWHSVYPEFGYPAGMPRQMALP
ncbi:MAG: FG-GAP-like repeat-containing protein, partial [Gammaproteobacteria bacterium]|nr:FG-GAP-like repeat-containing protein [Gammaproteobacteria bacterium]